MKYIDIEEVKVYVDLFRRYFILVPFICAHSSLSRRQKSLTR